MDAYIKCGPPSVQTITLEMAYSGTNHSISRVTSCGWSF